MTELVLIWDLAVKQSAFQSAIAAEFCESITVDLSERDRVTKVAEFLTVPALQEPSRTTEKELVNG